MSQDQPHFAIASENQSPPPGFCLFGSHTTPTQQFRDTPLSSTPIIDPLLVDNFAKDFQLEPVQCANLCAFIQVTRSLSLLAPIGLLIFYLKDRLGGWDPIKI
jgi:hypothetical protein